jgi:hypothetical protein
MVRTPTVVHTQQSPTPPAVFLDEFIVNIPASRPLLIAGIAGRPVNLPDAGFAITGKNEDEDEHGPI